MLQNTNLVVAPDGAKTMSDCNDLKNKKTKYVKGTKPAIAARCISCWCENGCFVILEYSLTTIDIY